MYIDPREFNLIMKNYFDVMISRLNENYIDILKSKQCYYNGNY